MGCQPQTLAFDTGVRASSIVSTFGLTCQRKWIKRFVDVLHQIVHSLGLLAFGLIADRWGRQKASLYGLCFSALSGILAGFCTDVGGFAFFHACCLAFARAGLFAPAFILMLEMSGKTMALLLLPAKYLGGGLCCCLLALLIPSWSSLQMVAFALSLAFFIPLTFLLHESPPWLLSQNRCDEARDVAKRAALMNGREIKVQILHPPTTTAALPAKANNNIDQPQTQRSIFLCCWKDVVCNFNDESASFYRSL